MILKIPNFIVLKRERSFDPSVRNIDIYRSDNQEKIWIEKNLFFEQPFYFLIKFMSQESK